MDVGWEDVTWRKTSKRTKREMLNQQGLRSKMQAPVHLLFLLLASSAGATEPTAAPCKTCGNEHDLEAPKLQVSHYVGVAVETEWLTPHSNWQTGFPIVSLAQCWEGTQLNVNKFSWTWELPLVRVGQTRQKSLLRLWPSLWDDSFCLLADILFLSYLKQIMKVSFETLNTSYGCDDRSLKQRVFFFLFSK